MAIQVPYILFSSQLQTTLTFHRLSTYLPHDTDVLAQAPFYKYVFLSTTSTSDFFPPEFCPFFNNKVGVFFHNIGF